MPYPFSAREQDNIEGIKTHNTFAHEGNLATNALELKRSVSLTLTTLCDDPTSRCQVRIEIASFSSMLLLS